METFHREMGFYQKQNVNQFFPKGNLDIHVESQVKEKDDLEPDGV